ILMLLELLDQRGHLDSFRPSSEYKHYTFHQNMDRFLIPHRGEENRAKLLLFLETANFSLHNLIMACHAHHLSSHLSSKYPH
ncbi:MAG: hypothetical protein IKG77_04605, partial [Prevotella sp.]|nr:hypothetical protein [Prevotella sp.]